MKVKKLIIKNVGMVADTTIELDKPLILFYGEIRQGKTTILNCVKYALGAPWPEDIIQHGKDEASVTLEFENGSVSRSWYIGKNGPTARAIQYIKDGKPVPKPAEAIAQLLNPYLLDQDYLRNMTELERKQYFVKLFNVDTSEFDTYYASLEENAKNLRATVKGYGEIDLTEYKATDVSALRAKRADIQAEWEKEVRAIGGQNATVTAHNTNVERSAKALEEAAQRVQELEAELVLARAKVETIRAWQSQNLKMPLQNLPPAPDNLALEIEIDKAAQDNVRAEQYQKNLARAKQKEADEARILEIETQKRDIKQQKADKLSAISATCGIPGLAFDQDGNFVYQDTTAGMLSTSQLMKLSSELSALYPEGFGVELLDRGESLGKSIFEFVERAKKEEKTILAAIVGERPAKVPENIGVFVVEDGKVKP